MDFVEAVQRSLLDAQDANQLLRERIWWVEELVRAALDFGQRLDDAHEGKTQPEWTVGAAAQSVINLAKNYREKYPK